MRNEIRRRRHDRLSSAENIHEEDGCSPTSGRPYARMAKKRTGNKWFKIISVLCIAHTVRHCFVFFSNTEEYLKVVDYPTGFDLPILSSSVRNSSQLNYEKLDRRRRTTPVRMIEVLKPPFLSVVDDSKNTDTHEMDSVVATGSAYPSFPITDHVAGDYICGYHQTNDYNIKDRIIISGILSHPVAAELALTLSEGCGVRHIFGLSDHLLNSEESSRLEFLLRRIPNLKLKVEKGALGDQATQELFESFMPTHVFYFGMDVDEKRTFLFRSGTNQLEQICNSIIKIKSKSPENEAGTKLLYVSSNLAETNKNRLSIKITSILLATYRMKYQLDARVLNLPYIFGPFKDGAAWLHSDEFVRTVNEMTGLDQDQNSDAISKSATTTSFNMTQPIMSIPDAVRSILVSANLEDIQNNRSIPILLAPKSQTTLLNLSKTLILLFKTSIAPNIKALDTSILPILSYNYKRAKPYRDPTDFHASQIENRKTSTLALNNTRHHLIWNENTENGAFSQLERRQHNIFPCISVCASFVECKSSIWDSIAPISKRLTKDCKFLLYTADFSPTLSELPMVRDQIYKKEWPRESFCQLAFVSSNSTIVKNTIQKEVTLKGEDASTNETAEEWNGQLSSNRWILVWVEGNDELMHQADLMIPKTNPESLLSLDVVYVFYIEPQHYKVIPPLQLFYEMTEQTSIAAQRTDEYLIPEKHVAFFTHAYNESAFEHLDVTKSDYVSEATKIIIEQNNKTSLHNEGAFQAFKSSRQNEAYSISLIWQKEAGVEFELIDTALMLYPVHNIRSRQFRCEWYEEQLVWSNDNNRNLEALSLSFVLNRWRRQGKLLPNTIGDNWGEMVLLGENGEELSPSDVDLKKSISIEKNREEPSPGDVELKKTESFGENGEVLSPAKIGVWGKEKRTELRKFTEETDPRHFVKVHSAINARKFYSH